MSFNNLQSSSAATDKVSYYSQGNVVRAFINCMVVVFHSVKHVLTVAKNGPEF